MPNGKPGDNPLTDLVVHGAHPFPPDIEAMLIEIDSLGRKAGRRALGENWPFSLKEFDWERGENLDEARELLAYLLEMLAAGRGDEILVSPLTQKPLKSSP
jgi:hypothetical protein